MPFSTMALSATASGPLFHRRSAGECLTTDALCGPSEAPLSVIGRSLVVCTALAAAFAGMIATGVGHIDGVAPAHAAVEASLAMPKPRLKLDPSVAAPNASLSAAEDPRLAWSRPDRVPYQFLIPQGPDSTPDDILEFGPMRIRRHLVETIVKAARVTGIDPALLMAIADKESSFSTHVQARTSSATGLFQFIERTWLQVVRDFGARHGLAKEAAAVQWVDDDLTVPDAAERARILELRRNPYLSALLAAEMLSRDRVRIANRIGRDLTRGETYLSHFLGPDDAERFMAKVVGQPNSAAATLLPRPAKANKPIFFARVGRKAKSLSVAEVHGKFEAMMGTRLDRYRDVHEVAGPLAYADAR
jgi:transglycosylase-like protein with SLT domain